MLGHGPLLGSNYVHIQLDCSTGQFGYGFLSARKCDDRVASGSSLARSSHRNYPDYKVGVDWPRWLSGSTVLVAVSGLFD